MTIRRSLVASLLPLTEDLALRWRSTVRGAVLALIVALALYILYVIAGHRWAPGLGGFFKSGVFSAVLVAASVLCLGRGVLIHADRTSWLALGLGMGLWALGTVWWSLFIRDLESPPYPSLADLLYLSFYPAAYVALMLKLRRRIGGIYPSFWLDGLIGVLSVGALGSAYVVPYMVAETGGKTAAVATQLAFPLGDLLLIAFVVGVFALAGWRPGRMWLLIGTGLILLSVADTLYLYRVAIGTFIEGTWLDAIWPTGMMLVAVAAWQPDAPPKPRPFEGWPVFLLPCVFTLGSLSVLLEDSAGNAPAELLAIATVVAALVRMGLGFHELRRLADARRQATTDELTGLANRRHFLLCLEQTLERARTNNQELALLVADLDGFKELNDTLGHHAGDLLLTQLGPRLAPVMREEDTLARLGGDEFAALLPATDMAGARAAVMRIQAALNQPFGLCGLTVHIEASIGVALYPDHGDEGELLMQRADIAMYQAKEYRTGFESYTAERDLHSLDRLGLLGELRRALGSDELLLHFQPWARLETGEIAGVEALVRWQHPERGFLAPDEFMPLAERTGIMRPLTLRVLEMSLSEARTWRDEGLDLTVAVNLAVPNLLDLQLVEDVARLLARWGVPAHRLEFEVTEKAVMADPARCVELLRKLEALGVRLSLDDFGTGSSTLAYLKTLPVHKVKIDKAFVLNMDHDEADAAIVKSTVELGRRLGLSVVAEGVEGPETWTQLLNFGCDFAQGFFLGQPVSAAELAASISRVRDFPADVRGSPPLTLKRP
jgi:diguanylate cyclase (GGDEF)-like protein